MLAYPLDEAETMLQEKLSAAEASLRNCEEDLEFLREQITVGISFPLLVVQLTDLACIRRWRLLLHAFITGMLCSGGKRRRRGKGRRTRSKDLVEIVLVF